MVLIATDKPRIIVGLGATGLSCARFLRQWGVPFAMVDSRDNPPNLEQLRREMPDVEIHLGTFDAELLQRAGELVVSPGVALDEPAIAAAIASGVGVCGDIDLFVAALNVRAAARKQKPAPVVAITGSDDKSTVTTLLGAMAKTAGIKVAAGGSHGLPVLDLLRADLPADSNELYVLELSSFQLERARPLHARVATVLNIRPDQRDRHPTLVSYHGAKHRIFRGAEQVVINRGDPLTIPLVPDTVTKWSFGLDAPDFKGFGLRNDGRDEKHLAFERELLMPVHELKAIDKSDIASALAALALGHAVGLPMPAMLQTLREARA